MCDRIESKVDEILVTAKFPRQSTLAAGSLGVLATTQKSTRLSIHARYCSLQNGRFLELKL